MSDFEDRVNNGESLVLIDGMVLDVREFLQYHPGGQFVIGTRLGNDLTKMFKGGPYFGQSEAGSNSAGHVHSEQAWLTAQQLVVGYMSPSNDTSVTTGKLMKAQKPVEVFVAREA